MGRRSRAAPLPEAKLGPPRREPPEPGFSQSKVRPCAARPRASTGGSGARRPSRSIGCFDHVDFHATVPGAALGRVIGRDGVRLAQPDGRDQRSRHSLGHRVGRIQRWTPSFFDIVARTIGEKTGRYFICQLCGSTVNKVPEGTCPICRNPPTQYRPIELPT